MESVPHFVPFRDADYEAALHSHCEHCRAKNCKTTCASQGACQLMKCPLKCYAIFHECKYDEHRLLCPNEVVPCINAEYGCPKLMPRCKWKVHLEKCPASVIHCPVEWNRWPLFSQEQRDRIPFKVNTMLHASNQQLDVALALQDQKMLNESMQLPKRVHRALRNSLTRRFPAVPMVSRRSTYDPQMITSNDTSHTVSDDDSEAPWEVSKNPPGLSRSVCNELTRNKVAVNRVPTSSLSCDDQTLYGGDPFVTEMQALKRKHLQKTKSDSCVLNFDGASIDVDEDADGVISFLEEGRDSSHQNSPVSPFQFRPPTSPSQPPIPSAPVPPSAVTSGLSLELTIGHNSRYIPKPKSMYTFLCAKEFRRDEFPWHFKNSHTDIQCGLNGWLEVRCPLFEYGCPYSYQNLQALPNTSIIHDSTLQSFGIHPETANDDDTSRKRSSSVALNDNSSMTNSDDVWGFFTELPFNILTHVANYLDSYSLCNLSLTSRLLRDVCCSLLEEKGVVVYQWQRVATNIGKSWVVVYKRWLFSTHFSPVERWHFTDHQHMSEHLKTCSFNIKNESTVPFRYVKPFDKQNEPVEKELEQPHNSH